MSKDFKDYHGHCYSLDMFDHVTKKWWSVEYKYTGTVVIKYNVWATIEEKREHVGVVFNVLGTSRWKWLSRHPLKTDIVPITFMSRGDVIRDMVERFIRYKERGKSE